MSISADYPVQLNGQYDASLSRWLWLVKWILALPHALVLMLLWPVLLLSSLISLVAILITGRFPRRLFNINLSVFRYEWRVNYYAYTMCATDRYPPFTCGAAEDYPATLDIAYPEAGVSRIKTLLRFILALPHLCIVSCFDNLQFCLQIFALITLLFKGNYHKDMFDLNMGLSRWGMRLCAYLFSMTDEYPPFRLD